MKRYILLLALFFLVSASVAQTKHTDPRPLKGLDASKIPALKSWKDFKAVPGGLLKNAIEIGKANYQPLEIGQEQSLSNDGVTIPSNAPSFWRILRAPNGTANWMWHVDSKKGGITTQSIAKPDGIAILSSVKNAMRIADPKSEFYPMSTETDEKGYTHLRYGQMYQGVPVWNKDVYIHLDPSGNPEIINGTYEPTPVNININPAITNPYSILVAIADLKAQNKWAPVGADVAKALGYSDPSAKLVIYPDKSDKLHLAYEVSVIPNLLESYYYIIDAQSGAILNTIARQCSLMPIDPKMPPVTVAHFATTPNSSPLQTQSGFTDASGTDLNGVTQQLRTYQHTDGKFYAIWDLPSFNAGASTLPDQPNGGAITLTLNNADYNQNSTIFHNTSTNNSWSDPTVVSAHHNMLVTYTYYNSTFGRKAIDDKNSLMTSIIHVTQNGQGMDNAFWNGTNAMIYGDGNIDFKPLAGGIDVAGHEMTHGVINSTCNLVYQDQSGSINESLADIFGVFVDTRNLTVGEDVMKDGKSCLRNLDNPHDPTALSNEPAKMSEYNPTTSDNGGVHTNSAIPSKAAAILINQLGRPDVQKIYYLAMTKYLTRNSQFIDCRLAIQSAAKELFTASSTQFNAVGPAFDAVEIFDPNGGKGTDPSQDDVHPESGGSSIIAFTDVNGNIGLFNVATKAAAFIGSPGSVAHVSNTSAGVDRAQLSAPKNGSRLYFIDSTKHLAFVDMSTGAVSRFPLFLQQDGDLWNAAVSADESFVALTSAYTNDPNIYIYNGKQVFTQPLMPQSNDGGAVASIDYPDVISFSPNLSKPKIGFDAFLNTDVGGSTIGYWSMYEIDYTAQKTYELFPTAGTGVDLGNIAYSNTSPNVITFNSITGGNDEDVWVADFKNNNIGFLGIDQKIISGKTILDADKPTFSPDDQYLAFVSPSNSLLLLYQLSNAVITPISAAVPIFQPYWFMVGGSGVHDASNASNDLNLSVYPSITSSNATAAITLNTAEVVTLDISNIFGMSVLPIIKERLDEGNHEIKFNTESLATGTYFVRLVTQDGMKVEKIVVER